MKQIEVPYFLFPRRQPRTIRGLQRWHQRLLDTCLYFEFKQKSLKAALVRVTADLKEYASAYERGLERPARLAMRQLNELKAEWEEELLSVKQAIRMVHDTNELIIGCLVRASSNDETVRTLQSMPEVPATNLLHGHGWMQEILSADLLEQQGYASFVTFGTLFDPAGFDVIAVPKPLRRVRFNVPYPAFNKRRKAPRSALAGQPGRSSGRKPQKARSRRSSA